MKPCFTVFFSPRRKAPKSPGTKEPDCFSDLQLDRILKAVLPDYADFHLEEYFYTPLTDPETVRYRQEVMEELEEPEKRAARRVHRRMRAKIQPMV